jgi:RNA polymerase sigma-70 factor (ECF subfamily)
MTDDPRQLLLRLHRGHDPSARRAWDAFSPAMLAHAASIVGRHDAEDVVQSVFLSLLRLPRRTLAAVTDAPAWLASLTRRAAINHLRTTRREHARRAAHTPLLTPPAPDHDELHAAVDSLPRRLREILVLKHTLGLTFDQIALALGANRNTAATRHRAAVAALRRLLTPQTPEVAHAL